MTTKSKSMREGERIMEPTDIPTASSMDAAPQHTPGPWRITVEGGFGEDGQPVAGVWLEAGDYYSLASLIPVRDVRGNANLMVAAPDLLAALRQARDRMTEWDGDLMDVIEAAIAKAEGR